MPDNIRLIFAKTGRARFISHLDLMAVFQRAFYRAQLPLRYSQGFNPHAYVSIAFPLSVGQAGTAEILDFGVTAPVDLEALPGCLNALLPEGITVRSAELNGRSCKEVVWASVELFFETTAAPEDFLSLFTQPLIVEKRSKKGSKPTDLLPMIRSYRCEATSGGLKCHMELAAQNPTLNPEYIVKAFCERIGESPTSITRTGLLDAEGQPF